MTETRRHSRMHRRHMRHHRSSTRRKEFFKKVELFFTRYFFVLLGIVFFIAGVVFLISQAGPGISFLKHILSFFTSPGHAETPGGKVYAFHDLSVLSWYLPALLVLGFPFLLYKRSPLLARVAAISGTVLIFAAHIKVLTYDSIISGNCYPTLLTAMVFTLVISLLPFWHAYKLKLGLLMELVITLVFISVLLLVFDYNWQYYLIFMFMFIFSGVVYLLYLKSDKLSPFYLQTVFSILLVVIFWLSRLMLRDSGDLVLPYILISSLFYITFFITGLLTDLSKKKAIFELLGVILMLINALFYWGSVMFILRKYGYVNLLGPFTLLLALFNGTLIYFSPKLNSDFTRSIYMLLTLFFLSMILPLVIHKDQVILFSSVFSVLLIVYATTAENRLALSGSFWAVGIMMLMLVYRCATRYFPALYEGAGPINQVLFGDGVLSAIFILPALLINHRMMKSHEMHLKGKVFTRRSYVRFLKILFLATLYLSAFWCWNFLFMLMFPIEEAKMISWFSFTCLYLIILIPVLTKQGSSLVNGAFVLAALTLLAYPLLVNLTIIVLRNKGLQIGGVYASCFKAHYFILLMIFVMMLNFYYYIMIAKQNKRLVIHAFQAIAIGYGLVLLLIEYDHLMIFTGYDGKLLISELASRNHLLPWSIIVLLTSLALTIYSLIRRHRFMRQVSFILFVAALVKIFAFDFAYLGDTYKVVVLLTLSVLMISFSFVYQKVKKIVTESQSHRVTKS